MKLQVVAGLIGIMLAASVALAQAPAFEVASIRAADPPTMDRIRSGQFRTGTTIVGSRLDFEFVSLSDLLPYIYRVKSLQISGPAWMRESRWNIQARLPEGATKEQVPEMLQDLMADRFKLAVHHEKREQPVYELVVGKGGIKLEAAEAADDAEKTDAAENVIPTGFPGRMGPPRGGPPGGPGGSPGGGPGNGGPDARGGRGAVIADGPNGATTRITPNGNCGMRLELTRLTMPALADALTPFLDHPVVDATGLKGPYKVVLDLPMEAMFAMMQNMARTAGMPAGGPGGPGGPGRPDGGGRGDGPGGRAGGPFAGCVEPGADGSDTSNAAITQAVQKLGLRLQARKMPFDTIVVDHLEKAPTEN